VNIDKSEEKSFKKSDERFSSTMDAIPLPQFIIDKNHLIIHWNKALEIFSKIPAREVIGTNQQWRVFYTSQRPCLADLIIDEKYDSISHIFQGKYIKSGYIDDGYEVTEFFPQIGSSGTWIKITTAPIRDEKGIITGSVEIIEDVTDQRQVEEALREANKKTGMFISLTRHAILNRLTVLRAYIEFLKEEIRDPKLLDYISKEETSAAAIKLHTEFTRMYQNLGEQKPDWHDVGRSINSAIMQLKPRGVELNISVEGIEVFANHLLENVFFILMENSLLDGHQVTKMEFSVSKTENGLVLFYRDNGVGISAENKQKIFQKGYGTRTGLELVLCREILSSTGITISESGVPEKGVQFEITVPQNRYRIASPPKA
jgi:PAS domain S-box-containing protein